MLKDVSHAATKMAVAVLALAILAIISPTTPVSATNEQVFNVQENIGIDASVGQLHINGSEIR